MHLLIAGSPLQLLVTSWTIALSNDTFHSHQSAGLAADATLALVVPSHRATKSVAGIKRKASFRQERIELQKKPTLRASLCQLWVAIWMWRY